MAAAAVVVLVAAAAVVLADACGPATLSGTHLHASVVDATSEVLPDEGKLKTVLYTLHMDYPTAT